jgi:hypothetical protein
MHAQEEDLYNFMAWHAERFDAAATHALAREFARRSWLIGDPHTPTLFLGELLEKASLDYVAFDVVATRKARRFDLNRHALAEDKKGTFDLVLNFGTTEHLMNQYNAFKVIHDAAKVGGHMFHQLPSTGYINHGYFSYNALMFDELAAENGYELVDLWFSGFSNGGTVMVNQGRYAGVTDGGRPGNDVEQFRYTAVPNAAINVLLRKQQAGEFRVGLELKTAASGVYDGQTAFDTEYVARKARRAPHLRPFLGRCARWVGRRVGLLPHRAAG